MRVLAALLRSGVLGGVLVVEGFALQQARQRFFVALMLVVPPSKDNHEAKNDAAGGYVM